MSDTDEMKWINLEPFYTIDNELSDKGLIGRYNVFPVMAQDVKKHCSGDSFDIIYIVHALEHICSKDAEQLLKDCWDLLRPDGYIEVETPDLDKACKLWLAGKDTRRVLGLFYGGETNEAGQLHQTGFNWNRYKILLKGLGYHRIEEIEVGDGHDIAEPEYDIRVRAYKCES